MSEDKRRFHWPLYLLAAVIALGIVAGAFIVLQSDSLSFLQQEEETLLPVSFSDTAETSLPIEALLSQAETAVSTGDLNEAITLYERTLELGGDLSVMRRLFDVALLKGDRAKAESVLGLLSFRSMPEDVLDALRGLILLREGSIEEAREFFLKDEQRAEHAYGLLLTHILTGEHDDALHMLVLLQHTADPLLVHAARSVQGAYDEFALFEDGDPEHRSTLLARALAEIGQCPSAELLLADVLTTESDYRDAWIVRGYCQLMLGAPSSALEMFETAYALDPEKAEIQYFLGMTHEKLGSLDQAKTYLSFALQNGFEPKRSVREKLAALSLQEGSIDAALEQYQAMHEEDETQDPSITRTLLTLLIEDIGDLEGARELAQNERDAVGDTADVLDFVGWVALLTGDLDQAATFLNAAVQQDPELSYAWYHKGMLEGQAGAITEALKSYRKAYDLSLASDQELAVAAAEGHNALLAQ